MSVPRRAALRMALGAAALAGAPHIAAAQAYLGGRAFASTPAEFGRFLAEDTAKWAGVIRAAAITAQ